MSDKKWKAGDIVRLKSGGPSMTVDRYVPTCVPDFERVDENGLSRSPVKPDGEAVRCIFFPADANVGGAFTPFATTIEVHEEALVSAEVKK